MISANVKKFRDYTGLWAFFWIYSVIVWNVDEQMQVQSVFCEALDNILEQA